MIKVEKPGEGDPARRMDPFFQADPHPEKSVLFLYLNNDRKGITLNLKSEWVRRVIKELVRDVDIAESAELEKEGHIGTDFSPEAKGGGL